MSQSTPNSFYRTRHGSQAKSNQGHRYTPSRDRDHRSRQTRSLGQDHSPHFSFGPGDSLPLLNSSNIELDQELDQPHHSIHEITQLNQRLDEQADIIRVMKATQEEMKKEIEELRTEISLLKEQQQKETFGPPSEKKRKVKRALTDLVCKVHDSMDDKLDPQLSSTAVQNKRVMESIQNELFKDPENNYSKEVIALAVKRKYETERRNLKEEEKGESKRQERTKKAKYEQRKQRKYERRKSVVTQGEMEYYSLLSKVYMSEESDDPDSEGLIIHKPPWRSQKVNEWMEELDKRYKVRLQKMGSITPAKGRITGLPACSSPPSDAPVWAIHEDWSDNSPGSSNLAGISSEADVGSSNPTEFELQ